MLISDWSSDVCSSDLAAGVGKSSLALTFALAAAGRGEHAVFFAFDEGRGTLEARARTIGQPLDEALASGKLRIQQIDPAELSPGEFAANVRASVEQDGARVVVIDRSEEHTSELQSLMRISYAVFCLKKNKKTMTNKNN